MGLFFRLMIIFYILSIDSLTSKTVLVLTMFLLCLVERVSCQTKDWSLGTLSVNTTIFLTLCILSIYDQKRMNILSWLHRKDFVLCWHIKSHTLLQWRLFIRKPNIWYEMRVTRNVDHYVGVWLIWPKKKSENQFLEFVYLLIKYKHLFKCWI